MHSAHGARDTTRPSWLLSPRSQVLGGTRIYWRDKDKGMEKRAQTRRDHCQSSPGTDHWLRTGPVHTQLLTASSWPSCSWLSTANMDGSGRFSVFQFYFLFQPLGILTFIIQSPFMAPNRKNKFIYMDFIFNKEIRHHFSVHTKPTVMETAQPRLCRNRTVDEGGEHKSGWERGPMGSSDLSSHLLTLC